MDAFAAWLTPYLTSGSLLALPLVVLGGMITAFNPCCLPMYPAVFGFIGGNCCKDSVDVSADCDQPVVQHPARITLVFVFGMATATSIMGLLTAGLGWVFGRFDTAFLLLLAAVPLLMGLSLLGLLPFRFSLPYSTGGQGIAENRFRRKLSAFGAGLLFSFAVAPCATPILLGILTLVAMQGDLIYGGALMFVYGLGAGLPLLFVGHGFHRMQKWFVTTEHREWLQRLSGLLLIGVSLYIVLNA